MREENQIRQYKAIGNAVPPVMMLQVADALSKTIDYKMIDSNSVVQDKRSIFLEQLDMMDALS